MDREARQGTKYARMCRRQARASIFVFKDSTDLELRIFNPTATVTSKRDKLDHEDSIITDVEACIFVLIKYIYFSERNNVLLAMPVDRTTTIHETTDLMLELKLCFRLPSPSCHVIQDRRCYTSRPKL